MGGMTSAATMLKLAMRAVRWAADTLLEIGFALVMLYWVSLVIEMGWHLIDGGVAGLPAWFMHISGAAVSSAADADGKATVDGLPVLHRWLWVRVATAEALLIAISWGVIALRLRKARTGR